MLQIFDKLPNMKFTPNETAEVYRGVRFSWKLLDKGKTLNLHLIWTSFLSLNNTNTRATSIVHVSIDRYILNLTIR